MLIYRSLNVGPTMKPSNRWLARMRASMAQLTPQFSSNRMMREYVETYYLAIASET